MAKVRQREITTVILKGTGKRRNWSQKVLIINNALIHLSLPYDFPAYPRL